jgi:hypothetical protein
MNPALQWELYYPHPAERVWKALTDPLASAQWLHPEADVIDYHVVHSVGPRRISYALKTHSCDTIVSFDLSAAPGATNLRVRMDECCIIPLDSLKLYLAKSLPDPSGHPWVGIAERSTPCPFKVPHPPATAL